MGHSTFIPEGHYMTVEEYADHIGVSYSSARRWCAANRAHCIKFGRTWLIRVRPKGAANA